jgi:hypothetical protein
MKARRGLKVGLAAGLVASTMVFVSSAGSAFAQTGQNSFAGYADPVQCTMSCKLVVSFTVPSVQCPSANTEMALFGGRFVTLQRASAFVRNGTRLFPLDTQGGVIAGCSGVNAPFFKSVYQFTDRTFFGDVPRAGDSMKVVLNIKTPGAAKGTIIKIHDITQSWTQTMSGESPGPISVLAGLKAWGCYNSGACLPVPEFTSPVQFSGVSFNGAPAQDPAWQASSVIDLASDVEASSSPPPLVPVGTFSVTWASSCSPDPGARVC